MPTARITIKTTPTVPGLSDDDDDDDDESAPTVGEESATESATASALVKADTDSPT